METLSKQCQALIHNLENAWLLSMPGYQPWKAGTDEPVGGLGDWHLAWLAPVVGVVGILLPKGQEVCHSWTHTIDIQARGQLVGEVGVTLKW